mmetsp:Transcript_24483/g.70279  ORF Transcript_24483/g.70279 Transcript_24483/m.70279 type:complete len:1125 (+) Transcript_24483:112-3486(+)
MTSAQVDKPKFVELLKALSSSDNSARQKAETLYQQAKKSEPDNIIVGVMLVLGSTDVEEGVRRHAAVLLRQMVMRGHEKDFVFARLPLQGQQEVAGELLRLFEGEPMPKLQRKIGEVVAKLAEHVCDKDDPRGSLAPGSACGWPALLPLAFRMADASASASADACEAAVRLLKDLVETMKEEILSARQQLESIIQNALVHANLKLRTSALLLVCEIVGSSEKKAWAPLMVTTGVLVQVVQQLAAANEDELLQQALQAFIDTAAAEPDFFKAQLQQSMEPAQVLAGIARSREGVEDGLRNLALEWLVSYLERKTKWLMKHVRGFPPLVLQCCMDLMLEMEDGEEVVRAWAARMDDEEGEEDSDELFHAGEEAIDRVVKAVEIEGIGAALSAAITASAAQDSWQAKHAALAAIRQTVEYVEDKSHVDAMAQVCLGHLQHPHARVRFMALLALGQLANDQAPHFQESNHRTVMPTLLSMMDDSVDRVAAMAMSAFTSFGESLDNSLMAQYAQTFMEKLCVKLQTTQHRGVREEAITCIAVIAGVVERDFSRYYDDIMPVLKHFVMNAKGEKENRLRGKSFECMSLLGLAVGKERFLPDANEALTAMMTTPLEADDVQREYIKEASERICQCLKRDFAPFLPNLLQGIFKSLSLAEEEEVGPGVGLDEDGDEDFIAVTTGDGQVVRVKTSKFDELMQSIQLLHTFMAELEGAFFDWVQPTANALLPLLSAADDASYLCDEVRGIALQNWALLIRVAREGAKERGLPPSLAGELFRTGLGKTFGVLEGSPSPEMLGETASGITQCIKSVGPGVLAAEEIGQMVPRIFTLMDQSLERTRCAQRLRRDHRAAGAVPGLADDEDEDDEEECGEEQLRHRYTEILGALMSVASAQFLQCMPQCVDRIRSWIGSAENKVLALFIACELIANLKEQSEPAWPVFMPEVFRVLGDANADARTAAAYAVNVAAPLASFAEAAPEAFRRLAEVVGSTKPGRMKRDEKSRMALDHAVAALVTLAKEKPSQCPPDVQAWPIVISRLPLRNDGDEAKKVHETIVDLVLEEHPGLLGGPGRQNLGQVLSVLAEVYHVENICKRDIEEKILKVFRSIPVDVLRGYASGFTEKQQKKIEKMLTS